MNEYYNYWKKVLKNQMYFPHVATKLSKRIQCLYFGPKQLTWFLVALRRAIGFGLRTKIC